ncbi:hypothetical protein, partial [Parablautia intestinalis]|uniref:hypothetical protein n=1 Tax=Parablautia intestinalis TaxID=2320100 RepID=UPI002412B41D
IISPPDFLDRLYHSFYVSIKWGIRQTSLSCGIDGTVCKGNSKGGIMENLGRAALPYTPKKRGKLCSQYQISLQI